MGLIRKRPGDKIEISPIKLWGVVAVSFFVLGISVVLVDRFSARAQESRLAANVYAQVDSVTDGLEKSAASKFWDPFIPKAEDPGLVVIAGFVSQARLVDDTFSSGEPYQDTGDGLKNVSVSIYEGDPLSATGLTVEGDIGRKFSEVFTDEDGAFALQARKVGSKNGEIYLAFHCNGRRAGLKALPLNQTLGTLDFLVNCNDDLQKQPSPPKINFVDRISFLECVTDNVSDVFDGKDQPLQLASKGEELTEVTSLNFIGEHNFDPRYSNPDSEYDEGIYNFWDSWEIPGGLRGSIERIDDHKSEGAFWEEDCKIRYPNRQGDCEYYYKKDKARYLTQTFHIHLPPPVQMAYRTVENRSSLTTMNVNPFANASSTAAMAGGYMGGARVVKNPDSVSQLKDNEEFDSLASCEIIERSKQPIMTDSEGVPDNDNTNTEHTVRPIFSLMKPNTWEEDFVETGLLADEMKKDYCVTEGGEVYTKEKVYNDPILNKKYWTPIAAIPEQALVTPWTSENQGPNEVGISAGSFRKKRFEEWGREADSPPWESQKVSIMPPGRNGENTAKNVILSDAEVTGKHYSNVLGTPFADSMPVSTEDEVTIWDIGEYTVGSCSLSFVSEHFGIPREQSVLGNLRANSVFLDNLFQGNSQHRTNESVNSGVYMTPDAELREVALVSKNKADILDSAARLYSGNGDVKIASNMGAKDFVGLIWNSLIGSHEKKSFGQRAGVNRVSSMDILVKYPLNFDNFPTFFPAQGEGGFPGNHANYPWHDISGERCNVFPGIDKDPRGKIRTCRVKSCKILEKEIVTRENPDGSSYEDVDEHERPCTNEEEIDYCLTPQKDNQGASFAQVPRPAIGRPTSIAKCNLEVAGPYEFIARVGDQALEEEMEQELENVPKEPFSYGKVADEMFRLDSRLVSPNNIKVRELAAAHLDLDFSKNIYQNDNNTKGYRTQGPGGDYDGMFIRTQPPSLFSRSTLDLSEVTYHCNGFPFNVSGSVLGGDWDCSEPEECLPGFELGGLPDWAGTSGNCDVKNVGALPFEVTPELLPLINGAANTYQVPGSLLLAVLELETNADIPADKVEEWSRENAVIEGCDPCADGIAVGPMQMFRKMAFEPYFSGSREGNNCNLADQLDAAANMLSSQTFKSCGSWSTGDVMKAARLYRGVDDTTYLDYIISIFKFH